MSVHITIAVRVEILTHPFEGKINIEIIILFEDCYQGKLYPTSRSQCQPTSGDLALFSSTVQPWFGWMHAGIPSFLMSQPWHGVVVYGLHCWELHRQLRKSFPASSNFTAYLFPATCRPRGSDNAYKPWDVSTVPRESLLRLTSPTECSQRPCAWEISRCQHEQGPLWMQGEGFHCDLLTWFATGLQKLPHR